MHSLVQQPGFFDCIKVLKESTIHQNVEDKRSLNVVYIYNLLLPFKGFLMFRIFSFFVQKCLYISMFS